MNLKQIYPYQEWFAISKMSSCSKNNAFELVENLRQRIQRESSVSLRKGFDALDWLGRGFLTNNEFKQAQNNLDNHSFLHFAQVQNCPQNRRFNKDKLNGRVSLPEFFEELTPKAQAKNY